MFNLALVKRLEDENAYLRKMVDNLLSRIGVEKVDGENKAPVVEHEEENSDGRIRYGGE